ncbi:hypothetical protein GCM10020000_39080 [Streptomyces olivoverticillatus]
MSLRKTPAIALVTLTAALSLTACGPGTPSADHTAGPSASSGSGGSTGSGGSSGGGSKKDCPTAQPGHKLVIVDSRSAESGAIEYHEAKPVCGADGIKWEGTSKKGKSHMAYNETPQGQADQRPGQARRRHQGRRERQALRVLERPRPAPDELPHGPCYANAYDIVDKGWDVGITELTQLPGN